MFIFVAPSSMLWTPSCSAGSYFWCCCCCCHSNHNNSTTIRITATATTTTTTATTASHVLCAMCNCNCSCHTIIFLFGLVESQIVNAKNTTMGTRFNFHASEFPANNSLHRFYLNSFYSINRGLLNF